MTRIYARMTRIGKKFLSSLIYHSIFDYPLTVAEIHRFLISDRPVSEKAAKQEINNLLKSGEILSKNGFILSSSIIHHSLSVSALRLRRQKISAEKLEIADRSAKIISIIPWVKMVAVTGALAMENAGENDDIDLMIVAANNRLWIVRPMALLLVSFFFKRRRPAQKEMTNDEFRMMNDKNDHLLFNIQHSTFKDTVCLNLWLDESALAIPAGQRNLYTAHELAQMKPVINKDGTYERMMTKNAWGKEYLANAWKTFEGWQANRLKRSKNFQLFSLFNFLNRLAFNLQFRYMKPKMTNERVSIHAAFFHPGNRADTILSEYDRLCHRNF